VKLVPELQERLRAYVGQKDGESRTPVGGIVEDRPQARKDIWGVGGRIHAGKSTAVLHKWPPPATGSHLPSLWR